MINISSIGSRHGLEMLSLHCSSKAALKVFTRCWAVELSGASHTVNTANAGIMRTELMREDLVEKYKEETTPAENRIGTADDIAPIVVACQ